MRSKRAADGPPGWLIGLWAFVLFLVWSNSFVAIGFLLGGERVGARFDWLSLTVARHLSAAAVCAPLCLLVWRRTALRLARRHARRLVLCGLLAVPCYHLPLYYAQQHGIAPPIASLQTSLAPLFLALLAAAFLGERLTARKSVGFLVALAGLVLIATSKGEDSAGVAYPTLVAVTALAPLSWACYSALTKPVSRDVPPVLWAYLALVVGTLPLVALAPWHGGRDLLGLDLVGWGALLFLALLCTVFGNAAWTWLVKHMPAASVGFTIFLNPPLTTLSKVVLSAAFPAWFAFQVAGLEWLGGLVVLLGLAVALGGRRARPPSG